MILIVEPSTALADAISDSLKMQGLSSVIASSAADSIAQADENDIDLVIIELLMSKHNGLEFIYEFRSYEDWWNVPIIIYTHLTSQELGLNKQLASEMGVVDYFYKPSTSLKQLTLAVKSSLRKHETT